MPQPNEADINKPLVITIPEVADEADAPTFVFAEENTAEAAETVNQTAVASPVAETTREEAVVVETVAVEASSVETQAAPEAASADDSIAAAAQAVETATTAVAQPVPQQTAAEPAAADLGGLVLVQTDPAALSAVQPEPEQPKGLRRADVAPAAPTAVPEPQQLQQVETHRS
ncbi:hypothetical protein EIKCOROL_01957 [Eikenella corrodens ATCC 23834]|nr:hypothetical protein EIKCOROL_01957 [Eikenella corrodens ATCC 23834]